jgi:hypothetical protein
MFAKENFHGLNRIGDPRHEGIAGFRILDRKPEHLLYAHRAVVAKKRQPASESSRHTGCKQARSRNLVKSQGTEHVNRGCLGGWALPAYHLQPAARNIPQHDRDLATQSVQMRLNHLQNESGGDGGIECVASLFQDRHSALSRKPVGRAHHAKGSLQLGARCERHSLMITTRNYPAHD